MASRRVHINSSVHAHGPARLKLNRSHGHIAMLPKGEKHDGVDIFLHHFTDAEWQAWQTLADTLAALDVKEDAE
jgi:hypothetical protein